MENQLTNEEKAKVAAMYLGCDVLIKEDGESKFESILEGVNISPQYKGDVNIYYAKECGHLLRWSFDECKLILTPLDKITDQYKETIARICGSNFKGTYDLAICGESIVKGKTFEVATENIWTYNLAIQQLIMWGYAVPLFFSLNHWANGKTAIELKIAIDKTQTK